MVRWIRGTVIGIFVGLLGVWVAPPARAADAVLEAEVRRGFEEILDLWRDGRYDDLYARTRPGGKITRESFRARLAAAPLRPACCWEKLQEVTVRVSGSRKATLHAKVGLEGGVEVEYKTRSFTLKQDGGVWRVAPGDLLALAEAKGKVKRRGPTVHTP